MSIESAESRRLASEIIDAVGDAGINTFVYRHGPNGEGGWEIEAVREDGSERWSLRGDCIYPLAVRLAEMVR